MVRDIAATAVLSLAIVSALLSQGLGSGTATAKSVTYDATITADRVYTGTMDMAVGADRVTGNMKLTSPTEITGKVAGTVKAGVLALEFPFHMAERNCEGTARMNITMPPKPGPAMGTLEVVGCGREENDKLTGTVELKPAAPKVPMPKTGGNG
jgi:alkyl sulfatase BDS1-like metallo-beta-lactamase superfamily hydrolase